MVVEVALSSRSALSGLTPDVVPVPPQAFCCMITGELFDEPVTDREGHTYERSAITTWINLHGTSPITRRSLQLSDLTPNRALSESIAEWRASVGLPAQSRVTNAREPRASDPSFARTTSGEGPVILEAVYGCETALCVSRSIELASRCARTTGIVPASNMLFQDPMRKQVKQLRIVALTADGRIVERTAHEGGYVDLRDVFTQLEPIGFTLRDFSTPLGPVPDETKLVCTAIAVARGSFVNSPSALRIKRSQPLSIELAVDGDVTSMSYVCQPQRSMDVSAVLDRRWRLPTSRRFPRVVEAAYGDFDRANTRLVIDAELAARCMLRDGVIPATNEVFGDPAFGVVKQLSVTLLLPDGTKEERVAREGQCADVRDLFWRELRDDVLQGVTFLSASYGDHQEGRVVSDCLPVVLRNVRERGGVEASNAVFGNPAANSPKVLRVAARIRESGRLLSLVAKEGTTLDVAHLMFEPEFKYLLREVTA